MKTDTLYDVIIIGGGCAGLSAGLFTGRAELKTLIIEKCSTGGQASSTDTIRNYPGIPSITGSELSERIKGQAENYGCTYIEEDVSKVSLADTIKTIKTNRNSYNSKTVILANGCEPKKAGFDGETEFFKKGVSYSAKNDADIYKGKEVFVIGAGYSSAKEALYLCDYASKITIIARENEIQCEAILMDKLQSNEKINILYNTEIICVKGNEYINEITMKNNTTNETNTIKFNSPVGVFVFAGSKPDTDILKDQIILDDNGYVVTDNELGTSLQGVFAAGDIREKKVRQIITAAADGAIAATQAINYLENYS